VAVTRATTLRDLLSDGKIAASTGGGGMAGARRGGGGRGGNAGANRTTFEVSVSGHSFRVFQAE